MKYSRNRINSAGAIIASEQPDILDYAESMNVIDDCRKLHLPVLEIRKLWRYFAKSCCFYWDMAG